MEDSTYLLIKDLAKTYEKLPSSALILIAKLIEEELEARTKVVVGDVLKPIKTCVKEVVKGGGNNKPNLRIVE